MNEIDQQIPDQFRCPICLEIPEGQIFQCKNGHTLCSTCLSKSTSCPQCRISFREGKIRNRVLESFLDSLKIDCPYKNKGCSERFLKQSELHEHSLNCAYNLRKIAFCKQLGFTCNFTINLQDIPGATKHLQRDHDFLIQSGWDVQFFIKDFKSVTAKRKLTGKMWTPIILKDGDSDNSPTFVILTLGNTSDKSISWVSIFLGDFSDGAEYHADFFVKSESEEASNLEWKIPCVDLLHSSVSLQNPVFRIPISVLLQHYCQNGGVTVTGFLTTRRKKRVHERDAKMGGLETRVVSILENKPKLDQAMYAPMRYQLSSELRAILLPSPDEASGPTNFPIATCNTCGRGNLTSVGYKCLQCAEFNLCQNCWMVKEVHKQHVFVEMRDADQKEMIRRTGMRHTADGIAWEPILPEEDDLPQRLGRLLQIIEDFSCDGRITNGRGRNRKCGSPAVSFVCLECRSYNLCTDCMSLEHSHAVPSHSGNGDNHVFAVARTREQVQFVKTQLNRRFPLLHRLDE